MVYLKQGKLNKAEKNFKQAIKMRPSFSEAYNQLGQLYQRKGMPEKAGLQFKLARFWSQLSDKIPAAERKRMRRTLNENQ